MKETTNSAAIPFRVLMASSELLKSAILVGLRSKPRGYLITARSQFLTLELYRDVKLLAPCINAVGVDTEKNLGY